MQILKNILFVSYIKNKGIRRICFIIGLTFSIYNFLKALSSIMSNIEYYKTLDLFEDTIVISIFALFLFYLPFLLCCVIKWIYLGFKNKE